jgi:SAM-dependent methyltransferase/uncharacterized protein YbaR (Trm112 family)
VRRRHLEALASICPVCRDAGRGEVPLRLSAAERQAEGVVVEGILECDEATCRREYPVIDGIPLLVSDLRAFVRDRLLQLYARDDLGETLEGLLSDCCGPGSAFDTGRQQLSTYAWDHYGEHDPQAPADGEPRPGAARRLLEQALELAGELPPGPVIDLGCAVGGTTFHLAERLGRPVLGADLNTALLRLASRVLHQGEVLYPLRRIGVVYDRRRFALRPPAAESVDFWACDAAALPLPAGRAALVVGLNLLDSVADPLATLRSVARVLAPQGKAILTCPYDWSPAVTPLESWLGGHSQRGPHRGAAEPLLRGLLAAGGGGFEELGLELVAEKAELDWPVRLHARSSMSYRVHLLVAQRVDTP